MRAPNAQITHSAPSSHAKYAGYSKYPCRSFSFIATAIIALALAPMPSRTDPDALNLPAIRVANTSHSWGTNAATYMGAMIMENGYTLIGGGGSAMST